ncbi:MAG: phosphoribosylamine--glycine ligase [Saprospiraceae bacterium]|nr:phosphoribosylamine--glycine ligase [Saprospiraceae bacterium]
MTRHHILILGGGGREHALAWKLAQSDRCDRLSIAPGNGGTREVGTNVDLDPMDFPAIGDFCLNHGVTMLVVGPEAPLVGGVVDYFMEQPQLSHILCIGPDRRGAMLEGSKAFAKEFMEEFDIPTAAYHRFGQDDLSAGIDCIRRQPVPIVLKADGLAAGKGVVICGDHDDAVGEFEAMLSGKFGAASATVVIEQFLDGIEFSVFALTDGQHYRLLPVAKDYKRIGEGDTGLNTGGMGSVSPVPFVDDALMHKVITRIVEPTIKGIRKRDMSYRGFVFFGLINVDGDPYVIEYNCRMGDPETQVVIPRIQGDLIALLESLHTGQLAHVPLAEDDRVATAVVSVSGGYPGGYEKGKAIALPADTDALLFHAGTKATADGLVTSGGRVLAATALAGSMKQALAISNAATEAIVFDGKYYRRDIGFDL